MDLSLIVDYMSYQVHGLLPAFSPPRADLHHTREWDRIA